MRGQEGNDQKERTRRRGQEENDKERTRRRGQDDERTCLTGLMGMTLPQVVSVVGEENHLGLVLLQPLGVQVPGLHAHVPAQNAC